MTATDKNCPSEGHYDKNRQLCLFDTTIEKFAIHSISKVFPIIEVIMEFLHIPGFIKTIENNCKFTLSFNQRLCAAFKQSFKILFRLSIFGAAYYFVQMLSTVLFPSTDSPEFLKPVLIFMCACETEKVITDVFFL